MCKKCICLLRVSTKEQELEGQRKEVVAVAKADDYKDEEIAVVEAKESAIKLKEEERETLNEMKDIIKNNPTIESVYVYAIDRLARKVSVIISVKEFLTERNINLVFINPTKMATLRKDAKGNMVENELTSMLLLFLSYGAEMEMKLKIERFATTKKIMNEQQKWAQGKPIFGYIKNPTTKKIEVNEEEAKVVRQIFEDYVENKLTMAEIYQKAVRTGLWGDSSKSRKNGKNAVGRIIMQKAYTGDKSSYDKKVGLIYPAIISKEIYDKAQKISDSKRFWYHTTKYSNWGKGLIRLTNNGKIMCTHHCNMCYKMMGDDSYHCSININAMDSLLWEISKMQNTFRRAVIGFKAKDTFEIQIKAKQDEIANIQTKIDEIAAKEEKAFKMYINGKVNDDIYNRMIDSLKKDLQNWNREKAKIESDIIHLQNQITAVGEKKGYSSKDIEGLTDEQKAEIIRQEIKEVRLTYNDDKSFDIEFDTYLDKIYKWSNIKYQVIKGGKMNITAYHERIKREIDLSGIIKKRIWIKKDYSKKNKG